MLLTLVRLQLTVSWCPLCRARELLSAGSERDLRRSIKRCINVLKQSIKCVFFWLEMIEERSIIEFSPPECCVIWSEWPDESIFGSKFTRLFLGQCVAHVPRWRDATLTNARRSAPKRTRISLDRVRFTVFWRLRDYTRP